MYIPDHFREINPDQIAAVIEAAPLACIVANTDQGLIANHIPLLAGPDGVLIGHVALGNDMHRLLATDQEVLVIFRGAEGYVSPNYYPTKAEHHRHVPTWNYQVVHIKGTIAFQHDIAAKRRAVGLLTRQHERRVNGDAAWKMADAPRDYLDAMLENIVAFQVTVQTVLAKSKLSQNRADVDHAGAVAGLHRAGRDGLAQTMADMRPKPDTP